MIEQAFGDLPMPVAFLRPAWFLENAAWDVATARDTGVIHSFLQPLDRSVPMVATEDVGRTAAALLQDEWTGARIVELEGPRRVSPNDLAAAFARVLGRPVQAEAVPATHGPACSIGSRCATPNRACACSTVSMKAGSTLRRRLRMS